MPAVQALADPQTGTFLDAFLPAFERDLAEGRPLADEAAASLGHPPFYQAYASFLGWMAGHLEEPLRQIEPEARPATLREILRNQLTCLSKLASQTLLVEYTFARESGLFPGAQPQAAFISECLHDQDGFAFFWTQNRVCADLIISKCRALLDAHLETLSRVSTDLPDLTARLFDGPSALTGLTPGFSDPHQGSRTVVKLAFENGQSAYYKPRPFAIDLLFDRILTETFEMLGPELSYRLPPLLIREGYGYQAGIGHQPCADRAEVGHFYRRTGILMGLLLLLDGRDFHFENLIADGAVPRPIDLEGVLHPVLRDSQGEAPLRTVLNSGLLPEMEQVGGAWVDRSGLSPLTENTYQVPTWQEVDGEPRIAQGPYVQTSSEHLPSLDGLPVPPAAHLEDVVEGFRLCLEAWRGQEARLKRLFDEAGTVVSRCIPAQTTFYSGLLIATHHPRFLERAESRREHLRGQLEAGREVHPELRRAELHDLLNEDIPVLHFHHPDGRLRHGATGALDGVSTNLPMEDALNRVRGLDDAFIRLNTELIRLSIGISADRPAMSGILGPPARSGAPGSLEDRAIVEAEADWIADELWQRGHVAGSRRRWFGPVDIGGHWRIQAMGDDLYEGTTGIRSFLFQHARLRGDRGRIAVCEAEAANAILSATAGPDDDPSLFCGFSGPLYHAGKVFEGRWDPSLLRKAGDHLASALARMERIPHSDVMVGLAGLLMTCVELHRSSGAERFLDDAQAVAEALRARAVWDGGACHWDWPEEGRRPLLGLAHGQCGTALALARLEAIERQGRWADLIQGALAFEDRAFSPVQGNWPDLRVDSDGVTEQFVDFWCHGSAGIGMARAAMLGLDAGLSAEHRTACHRSARAALASTLAKGFGNSDCLCHGDPGNLELVLLMEPFEEHAKEGEALGMLAEACRAHGGGRPWRFAAHGPIPPPGLMVGLAGVGYQMLRCLDPMGTPSILTGG